MKKYIFKFLFASFLLLSIAGSVCFVRSEQTVYDWDFTREWNSYMYAGHLLKQDGFLRMVNVVIESIQSNTYNMIPVVPLLPAFILFGPERSVYIAAIVVVYGLGALVSFFSFFSIFLSKEEKNKPYVLLFLTLALFIPQSWLPILRGYPDIGGLIFIFLIWKFHFQSLPEQPYIPQRIFLLVCAAIFRRGYVIWVMSYLIVWLAQSIIEAIFVLKKQRLHGVYHSLLVAACTGCMYYILLYPLSAWSTQVNLSTLYAGYRATASNLLASWDIFRNFGGYVIVLASIGFYLGIKEGKSKILAILLVQTIITFILHRSVMDFNPHHLYLFIPLIASLMVIFWVVTVRLFCKNQKNLLMYLFLGIVVWIGNWLYVLSPAPQVTQYVYSNMKIFPLVRKDLGELKDLLDTLSIYFDEDPGDVYVLASSFTLNSSILQNYCSQLYDSQKVDRFCSRIRTTVDVDAESDMQIDLDSMKYIVIGNPIQYHMQPNYQQAIGIPATNMLRGEGVGKAYQKMTKEWILTGYDHNKVFVYLYKRK